MEDRVDITVKERGFQGGEGKHATRTSVEGVGASMTG